MLTKKEARAQQLQLLRQLPVSERYQQQALIAERLLGSESFKVAHTIGVTMSEAPEFNTLPIIEAAKTLHKQIVVPKTQPHRQMTFHLLTEALQFERSDFGVLEPASTVVTPKSEIDLMIVPGLAFSANGMRLGFGGGYYDRYLADFLGETVALALNPQLKLAPTWPVETFDVQIKHIISATEVG